ncbi:hypothetical protein BACCIP111895_03967 [Neobacillus rhizosphaerae]|uniref:TerD domain-containing protein n=1 Tax=Neobacillus rhizosphaerae TaxID=2880965 RepID=A0ABN8KVY4_9BACI|nr:TerD family protein [Neobacillus rhizosphaerae]CAH2716779.1 hypothetical protein BACCIP111895_03967 [Neobacillus rhizosphaerae]
MVTQMKKGARVDLTSFTKITIQIGWDTNEEMDIDSSLFMVDINGKCTTDDSIIFYGNPTSSNRSIKHVAQTKYIEQFQIDLPLVSSEIEKLVISLSIYEGVSNGKTFGQIQNAYMKIMNTNLLQEAIHYPLDPFTIESALIIGEIYRRNGNWKFSANTGGFTGGLAKICDLFGIEITEEESSISKKEDSWHPEKIEQRHPDRRENQTDTKKYSIHYSEDAALSGESASGIIFGNVSNASTLYGMDKFNTPRGHGFAAENANFLYDKMTGKKVQPLGDDLDPLTGKIIKNGADRSVNGVKIQTKYCTSGSICISECFENGEFRYLNPDGSPMQIEVPSDKYDAAIQAMENRIKNGQVPGVTDPKEAKNIVRKGHFTYQQAKNIAKAGTVESITFDAVNGAIIAANAFGISATLTFATSIWNGDDFDVALKAATYSGLKVGGTTFVTAILSSQLSKAGLNSLLVGSSEALVSIIGPKASAMLVNAFRSGTNIYGAAAMKSAAKMLRGNAITGAVSIVVLSSVDVVNIFRGRISGAQLFKNIANTASTVAGGTAGWVGGATAGAAVGSVVPFIGTAVGGVIGGLLGSIAGGSVAGKVSNKVLNEFIEDDAEEMVRIIEKGFTQMAEDYLLNQSEAENIIDHLKDDLTGSTLKDMYSSSDREEYGQNLLINHVESEVQKRKKVSLPSQDEMEKGLRNVLEEMSDQMATA